MNFKAAALLLLLAFPATACKGKSDDKTPPNETAKVAETAPSGDKNAPADPVAAEPVAKTTPTASGVLVSLFSEEPQEALVLAPGTVTARARADGEEVEFMWNGVVFGSCYINLARTSSVSAMHKADSLYIVCETGEEEGAYAVLKHKVGDAAPTLVGMAYPDNFDSAKLDKLTFEAPVKGEKQDARVVAQKWLDLVSSGSKEAAIYSEFPLTIRSTDKKPACAASADALSFNDKTLACLAKTLPPTGHVAWEASPGDLPPLAKLHRGLAGEVSRFYSEGDGETMAAEIFVGKDGRVSAVVFDRGFFE